MHPDHWPLNLCVNACICHLPGDVTGTITVTADDGIRESTTMTTLAKLKPAFQAGGSTTAGNSSQTSDGAAAVLLGSRKAAREHGLPVLATVKARRLCPPIRPRL